MDDESGESKYQWRKMMWPVREEVSHGREIGMRLMRELVPETLWSTWKGMIGCS